MGYQNGCDTSGMEANDKWQKGAQQRTSVTSAKAQDTTKCQYERLSKTGPTDQGTK